MLPLSEVSRFQVLDPALGWVDAQLAQIEPDDVVREFDPSGKLIAMPNGADGRRVCCSPVLYYYSTPCIMCDPVVTFHFKALPTETSIPVKNSHVELQWHTPTEYVGELSVGLRSMADSLATIVFGTDIRIIWYPDTAPTSGSIELLELCHPPTHTMRSSVNTRI